jgi:ligand-binding sensor domain-containing protein
MRSYRAALASTGVLILSAASLAADPAWKLVRPSNTGIPGIQLHYARWAPDGTLWVVGRWPFWGEGGIGIYDIQNDLWTTLSNVDTPQPSQWVNEVQFDANGVAWIATDDGLAKKDGETWTIYNTSNAPFVHNQIDDVFVAPNGNIWVNNSGVNEINAAIFEFDGTNWKKFVVGAQIPFAPPWNQLSEVLVTEDGHAWVANATLNGVAVASRASIRSRISTRMAASGRVISAFCWRTGPADVRRRA